MPSPTAFGNILVARPFAQPTNRPFARNGSVHCIPAYCCCHWQKYKQWFTWAIIKTIQIIKIIHYVSIQLNINLKKLCSTDFWHKKNEVLYNYLILSPFCDWNHERNRRIKDRGQNKMVLVTWARFLQGSIGWLRSIVLLALLWLSVLAPL